MGNAETLKEAIVLVPEFADWGEPVYDPANGLFRIPTPDGTNVVVFNVAFYKRTATVLAKCLSDTYLKGLRYGRD